MDTAPSSAGQVRGRVLHIRLNRHKALNALKTRMMQEVLAGVTAYDADPDTTCRKRCGFPILKTAAGLSFSAHPAPYWPAAGFGRAAKA
jgi:enoyl-CoA hydratase/carnithine racemase